MKWITLLCLLTPCLLGQDSKPSPDKSPVVVVETNLGSFEMTLFADKAPVTTANFLRYVDADMYRDANFHRVVHHDNDPKKDVKINVIQAGRKTEEGDFEPIAHETTEQTGILHKDGILSMARAEVGTTTSHFFICIGDQPSLDFKGARNSDGMGFAAFGKVSSGMDVVLKIYAQPFKEQALTPKITIHRIHRK